jgi:hypothetical protein
MRLGVCVGGAELRNELTQFVQVNRLALDELWTAPKGLPGPRELRSS